MTRCKQQKLAFEPAAGRRVEGNREVATSCRFFTRLTSCFIDSRNQDAITHSVESLIQQRVYGLVAGYEDLQDHDDFRHDPVAHIVAENRIKEQFQLFADRVSSSVKRANQIRLWL